MIGNLVAGKTTVDFADTNLLNYITLDADSYTLGGFVYKVTYDETTGQLTFVNMGPIPSQGDIGSNVVKGVFSGIKNTIDSANNAVNNSIRSRLSSTSNTTSQKGQSGGDEDETYGLWAQAIYSHVNRDKTGSSAGAKFLTEDSRLKRFGTEVSVGADAKLTNNWNVSLDYTGEFRQHYENHTGTVSVRYDF